MSKRPTTGKPASPLRKKRGIWVYDGGPVNISIPKLIDRLRAKRDKPPINADERRLED
jgi:hypothetical protein